MTTDQVMELRAKVGFVTPFAPVEVGEPWLAFSQRGTYEWLMHPDDAFEALALGMMVNGKILSCTCVDVQPFVGALMIRAKDEDVNTRFIPPSSEKEGHV